MHNDKKSVVLGNKQPKEYTLYPFFEISSSYNWEESTEPFVSLMKPVDSFPRKIYVSKMLEDPQIVPQA